jgi:sugar phosphate permease
MDQTQQAVLAKVAWRLVPILTLAYVVNYLDRTNIGFAALTMNKELGLTATQFGIGAGVLFIGYTVFEIPSNLALYRFGARKPDFFPGSPSISPPGFRPSTARACSPGS